MRVQGTVPDTKNNSLDDPRPQHQNPADQRYWTQSGRDAASDEDDTRKHEHRRNDPEELRVFDGCVTF